MVDSGSSKGTTGSLCFNLIPSAKDDTGRVGVVIEKGCLFRGGKEQAIRSKMLQDDLIDCIILLPEKLFYEYNTLNT